MAKHVAIRGQPSPWLPAGLIEGCRVCASRNDLLLHLPQRGRVVEVGADEGTFSRLILERTNPTVLHLIDLDLRPLDPVLATDPRVRLHSGSSRDVLATFSDRSLDWVYIDADHTYPAVRRDARAAAPKIRPGGFMVFNDFAHADPFLGAYGVHRAVTEFAIENGWSFAWLAYEPHGLYDVALKKPS